MFCFCCDYHEQAIAFSVVKKVKVKSECKIMYCVSISSGRRKLNMNESIKEKLNEMLDVSHITL